MNLDFNKLIWLAVGVEFELTVGIMCELIAGVLSLVWKSYFEWFKFQAKKIILYFLFYVSKY